MTPRKRFVQAIRKIVDACPCRNIEYGACDVGCRCILADPHPQVPLCDCRWTGHAAAREAVEAFAHVQHGSDEAWRGASEEATPDEVNILLRECGMTE